MLAAYLQLDSFLLRCPRTLRSLAAVILVAGCSLLVVSLLKQSGIFYEAELGMVQVLASHPFYMSAQEAQINLMSDGANSLLCLAIALYFSLVLLREKRGGVQCIIVLLGLITMAVASLCAVFYGGVLNLSAPMSCLFITWIAAAAAGELRRLHQFLAQQARVTQEKP